MIEPKTLEKLKSIPEARWGEIYGRLVIYAATRLKLSGFQPRSEIDSVDPEDFVGSAIEKIFDGTRAWDFDKFPDIEIHLKGVVKSLISSHLKSSGRRPIVQEFELAETCGDTNDSPRDQSDYADETDELRITEAHWSYIEQQFVDDDDGLLIFYEWLDGSPPREIAASCNLGVKDVYNVIKKVKRVIKSLSKVFNNV
jgi:DNA-directed RNA polymerase specialized sigma24 family protein